MKEALWALGTHDDHFFTFLDLYIDICICRICHRHEENRHNRWGAVFFSCALFYSCLPPSFSPFCFLALSTRNVPIQFFPSVQSTEDEFVLKLCWMDGWIGTDPFQPGPISHHGQIIFRTGLTSWSASCLKYLCPHHISTWKKNPSSLSFRRPGFTPRFYGQRLTQSQTQTL